MAPFYKTKHNIIVVHFGNYNKQVGQKNTPEKGHLNRWWL